MNLEFRIFKARRQVDQPTAMPVAPVLRSS